MREADRRTIAPREEIIAQNRRTMILVEIRKAAIDPAPVPPHIADVVANWRREGLVAIAAACMRKIEWIDKTEGR